MAASKIEWTDETWNPVRGCTKISPGCKNCYAETFAERFRGVAGHPYEQGFDLRLVPDKLTEPLSWKKPRRVFVNSMSDLFQEDVPDEFIDRVFATMACCPDHTFQVLTKRAERMREYMAEATREGGRWDHLLYDGRFEWPTDHIAQVDVGYERITSEVPLKNVWLGVSVEDQQRADERIPLLLQTPAAVRFLSCEPLLGPLDIRQWIGPHCVCDKSSQPTPCDDYMRTGRCPRTPSRMGWGIVGGESGPGARPMHPVWAHSIQEQCQVAGVPFFFKQWGEWQLGSSLPGKNEIVLRDGRHGPNPASLGFDGSNSENWGRELPVMMSRVGKKAAGRMLDGRTWDEFPQAVPS